MEKPHNPTEHRMTRRSQDNDYSQPDIYHPSESRIKQCLTDRLLIVTPWQYHYRTVEENISKAMCKTMNCVVQGLCRTKDDWWKIV